MPGHAGETAGVGHRFEVGEDEIGAGVVVPEEQQIVRRQIGRIADRDEAAHPERGPREERERGKTDPARLGDERHASRRRQGGAEGGVEARRWTAVQQPHAVRTDEAHPGGAGPGAEVVLEDPPRGSDLGESRGDHTHRSDPACAGLVDDPRHDRGRHGDDGQVGRIGARGQVGVGGFAVDTPAIRVDRVQPPAEAAREQVGEDQPTHARGHVARPDHRDRPGPQKGFECHARGFPLIGEHGLEVGVGLLHGYAGVHSRPADPLFVVEAELGQHAQDRGLVARDVAHHLPHPDVTRRVGQPAEEQCAEPDAPVGRVDEHRELSRVAIRSLVVRNAHDPTRRAGLADRDDHFPIAQSQPSEGAGILRWEMGQVEESTACRGVEPTPERCDGGRVVNAEQAGDHDPAIAQRLLGPRCGGGGHDAHLEHARNDAGSRCRRCPSLSIPIEPPWERPATTANLGVSRQQLACVPSPER